MPAQARSTSRAATTAPGAARNACATACAHPTCASTGRAHSSSTSAGTAPTPSRTRDSPRRGSPSTTALRAGTCPAPPPNASSPPAPAGAGSRHGPRDAALPRAGELAGRRHRARALPGGGKEVFPTRPSTASTPPRGRRARAAGRVEEAHMGRLTTPRPAHGCAPATTSSACSTTWNTPRTRARNSARRSPPCAPAAICSSNSRTRAARSPRCSASGGSPTASRATST